MSVSKMLPPEHILVGVDWQSKKRAFEQVSIIFENSAGIARDKVFSALMQRERLGSTSIGNGGAIPHGCLEGAKEPLCALVVLSKPIQYGIGDDGGAVRNLFFLIAPPDSDETHLHLLGAFSQMLSDTPLMDDLSQCSDSKAAAERLAQWETAQFAGA